MRNKTLSLIVSISVAVALLVYLQGNAEQYPILSENVEALSRRDDWFDLDTCYYMGTAQSGDVVMCITLEFDPYIDKCPYPYYATYSGQGRCYK